MYRFYFQTTEASAGEEAVEAAAQAGGSLASGMAGMAMMGMMGMMMSGMNMGGGTGNSAQPGTAGGGGSPTNSAISTLGASLSLVPSGATAIAVFPPFIT